VLGLLAALLAGGVIGYLVAGSRYLARIGALELDRATDHTREARLLDETGRRMAAEATIKGLEGVKIELAERDRELDRVRDELNALLVKREQLTAQLQARAEALAAQQKLVETAEQHLSDVFQSLAAQSLQANSEQFMQLARLQFEGLQTSARGELEKRELEFAKLVGPVRDSLAKVEVRIGETEKERVGAYQSLLAQVHALSQGQTDLRRETGNLVGALRRPSVRGRWGELQLKRVVELAGMLEHVDFVTQPQVATDQGDLRPDLVIQMPGGRRLVVDAKAPLEAYLDSLEANDEALVRAKLADHARQLREHVQKLSRKQYWEQFEDTPDFVILFVPGEAFYSAALEQDPSLIEAGVRQKVLLATPTTLIALLRTVAHTWRQEALAEDARRIADLGKELYDRLQVMANHWAAMGQALKRAVASYNDAVGSLDTRVMSAARRFRELNIGDDGKEPVELPGIEATPREVQSEELRPLLPRITPRDSR
jgi:DNA recombination protein RmuC